MTVSRRQSQTWQLLAAGAVAVVLFVAIDIVTPFIALPLRQISSVIASGLLRLFAVPVARHGTILVTPNLTYDVVPACSGSTVLKVMLFLGTVVAGTFPRLSPGRRVLCVAAAVPLALLANGMRVAVLAGWGHLQGVMPGDFAHTSISALATTAAMAAFVFLAHALAQKREGAGETAGFRGLRLLLGVVLIVLFAPFVEWCVTAWYGSPLDLYGYVYAILGALGIAWGMQRGGTGRGASRTGTALFVAGMIMLIISAVVDINILGGVALVAVLLGWIAAYRGLYHMLSMLPFAGVVVLSFPTVSYVLNFVTVHATTAAGWTVSIPGQMLKGVCAAVFIPLGIVLTYHQVKPCAGLPVASTRMRWGVIPLLLLALCTGFIQYIVRNAEASKATGKLSFSYLQGEWIGEEHGVDRELAEFLGRENVWRRSYHKDGKVVSVLVTATGHNRHAGHPPAYCFTGVGWEVRKARRETYSVSDDSELNVTRLSLVREDERMVALYWFTDGRVQYADYVSMTAVDALRRATGKTTNWYLFRLVSSHGEDALKDFMSTFSWTIER